MVCRLLLQTLIKMGYVSSASLRAEHTDSPPCCSRRPQPPFACPLPSSPTPALLLAPTLPTPKQLRPGLVPAIH